jgi:hypothetical protein
MSSYDRFLLVLSYDVLMLCHYDILGLHKVVIQDRSSSSFDSGQKHFGFYGIPVFKGDEFNGL